MHSTQTDSLARAATVVRGLVRAPSNRRLRTAVRRTFGRRAPWSDLKKGLPAIPDEVLVSWWRDVFCAEAVMEQLLVIDAAGPHATLRDGVHWLRGAKK